MLAIYHSNILGFCVGTFGPQVQWVWCLARDNIESVPRVQAVSACLRVTVNPSACTTKKLRKPQPLLFATPVVHTGSNWDSPNYDLHVSGMQEQSSMDKGLTVAPYFAQWIRTRAVSFPLLINLSLYWIWSWWLMAYYPRKVPLW